MPNKNKNNNDLASPEDITSELELPTWRHDDIVVEKANLEMEADTHGLGRRATASDGNAQKLTLELEKQRALIRGLEAERDSRAEIINDLHATIDEQTAAREAMQERLDALESRRRKDRKKAKALRRKKADLEAQVAELEADIEAKSAASTDLELELAETADKLAARDQDLAQIHAKFDAANEVSASESPALLAALRQDIRDLKATLVRNESMTDGIRNQLADASEKARALSRDNAALRESLSSARDELAANAARINELEALESEASNKLKTIEQDHAEEIRLIRFELTEAEQTIGQHELINEQLASDLVDSRTQKHTLETQLTEVDHSAQSEITRLEQELKKARRRNDELAEQLAHRSEVIQSLLEEIAAFREDGTSTDDAGTPDDELEVVLEQDKVSRCLTGIVDGQEVRFPLFKPRLTIGRTQSNDLQLSPNYISRRHAVIVTDGGSTRIIDWGSRNGIKVNEQPVTEHFLKHGDVVTVGTFDFVYEEKARS